MTDDLMHKIPNARPSEKRQRTSFSRDFQFHLLFRLLEIRNDGNFRHIWSLMNAYGRSNFGIQMTESKATYITSHEHKFGNSADVG